ncbi:TetR family transcriptional regulator [Nonomuraea sp. 10N515B]|uniref:TetR family transcriptional regulator n=1 Tax=Nonomuraea sp. 10N515B TaxID=3457422 RepID=UPI003FCE3F00
MAGVVARDGLTGITIANVAAAAGLQRTLVLHYFGSRDELMASFITNAVAEYGDRMVGDDPRHAKEPIEDRLDRLFEPGAYHSHEDLVIWAELVARSARDQTVRQRLHELWTGRWLPAIEQQLGVAYPQADAERIEQVAYALACLVEAHWYFHLQGVDSSSRTRQAQQAARTLLATLDD